MAETPTKKEVNEDQERNDAAKADQVSEDANVQVTGTGLPPVVSAVDPTKPVPVAGKASKEEQEAAVALQGPGARVVSDAKTKITLKGGDTVTVDYPKEQVSDKVRSGGLIEFARNDVSVDASDVSRVEAG
jgi:hypothetical protein